jgi:hypothetical protein
MLLPVANIDTQITITGTNFIATTSAAIGAQGIATSYLSSTQLYATIPAASLSAPSTLQIDVYNPPPGGGFSATSIAITVSDATDAGVDTGADASADAAPDASAEAGPTGCTWASPCGPTSPSTCIWGGPTACGVQASGYCDWSVAQCNGTTYSTQLAPIHLAANLGPPGSISAPDCSTLMGSCTPSDTTSCSCTLAQGVANQRCRMPKSLGGCWNGPNIQSVDDYYQCEAPSGGFRWTFIGDTYSPCTP